jgi:hypothetical protein
MTLILIFFGTMEISTLRDSGQWFNGGDIPLDMKLSKMAAAASPSTASVDLQAHSHWMCISLVPLLSIHTHLASLN